MSWKDEAVRVLNDLYQNFEGAQWHEFELKTDTNLLLAKICYAIFGEPINELTDECDLSTAYDSSQKELAGKISEHIRNKVYKDVQSQKFLFKVIFVVCKEGDKPVHMQPLFCLFADGDPETANCGRRYIDMSCRTYKDWTDWKENNTLPIMEYAYPKYGFFSCSAYKEYEFDENRVPNVEFGESPRSSVGSQVARATDITTSIVGLVAGGVMIASMFTPLGPVVMLGSTIAGSSGAAWGFGRSVQRLVDKGTHDEDMTDLESWTHYLSLVAAPLSFGSNIFSARLAQGAILEGRIFSSSMRAFVTTLNFASLGVSGTLVGIGFYNLVEKQRAGNLESLDVVQFSMSIFFFSNTLIKPQFATNIIRNAQSQHFQNVDASMKTDTAKQTFKKYLDDNNGSGNIQERSKVVRNLNRMQDPSATFDKLGHNNYEQILIGGRKGKTFNLVESKSYDKTIDAPKILHEKMPNTVTQFSVEKYAKLEKHIGKHPDNVRINGRDIFKNASQQEKTRACKMLSQNNTDVVNLGFEVAEKMKITNVNDVLDIVEIVNAKCVDLSKTKNMNKPQQLSHIRDNMTKFVDDIHKDIRNVAEIRQKTGLGFKSDLGAAYHFRKHKADFPGQAGRAPVNVYLEDTPKNLMDNMNDLQARHYESGNVRHTHIKPNDQMAITVKNVGQPEHIVSMYQKNGAHEKFIQYFNSAEEVITQTTTRFRIADSSYMNSMQKHIAFATGRNCDGFTFQLRNGQYYLYDCRTQIFQRQ